MSDFTLIEILNLVRAEIARTEIGDVKRITGPTGEQGPMGETGPQGPQGPRGNDGKQGPAGSKGDQGKKGDKGVKGADGTDGVGIARVEQDLDNAIVVYLTDGNFYTIEMPLINDDGSLAKEVHYKSGGGGGGVVDLSGYVKRPSNTHDGKWLLYREPDGTNQGEWAPATTDLIETNGMIMFRDINGRFSPTPEELDELTNQLKVNRFIWEKIQELDLKAGGVAISETPPVDPENGMFWFDNSEDVMQLFIWHTDSGAWIPVAPPTTLEGRVGAGEATQAAIIAQIQESLVEQETIKNKVNALEGVVGEHSLTFTTTNSNPRHGEFNLKNSGMEIVNSISLAQYISMTDTDGAGNTIDLDRITEGDVLRFSSVDGQAAELKITDGTNGVFTFTKISGDLDRLSEMPYQFILLSSFDPAGLATIDYVDAQDKALDEKIAAIPAPAKSGPAPLLWKHNPSVSEDNLGNGEFRLSVNPVSGSADEWTIYFANRDARGQRWFPHDHGTSYSHAVDNQFATIRDRDAIVCHGKTKKWYFNQGNNNHAKLILTYYRNQFAMTNGKYYLITIPGYMPFFPYSADAYSNGTHS